MLLDYAGGLYCANLAAQCSIQRDLFAQGLSSVRGLSKRFLCKNSNLFRR
jgi:hypothetical protein